MEGTTDTPFVLEAKTFRTLFDTYWQRLFMFCAYHCHDEVAAKDMVQDIFCSLWKRKDRLCLRTSIETYLFQASRRKITDYFRDKYKRQQHQENLAHAFQETVHQTEEAIMARDLDRRLSSLIKELPARCREVYQLSRHQGLTNKEISLALDLSAKNVEAHLSKALAYLKSHLRAGEQ